MNLIIFFTTTQPFAPDLNFQPSDFIYNKIILQIRMVLAERRS
jgi:hypothetical protein